MNISALKASIATNEVSMFRLISKEHESGRESG